jgi:hypothetical protein
VALAFLLIVFLLVIAMIVVFVFPPSRWAQILETKDPKKPAAKTSSEK